MSKREKARKTGLARLWELAFTYRVLIVFACVLSLASVAASFLPFIAVYFIIKELILSIGTPAGPDSALLIRCGWIAAVSAGGAIVLNFCALMCSHLAAFRTLYKTKYEFMVHLAHLPMGFHSINSSGKLRKIVDENIEKLESFIAHQLPDLVGSLATPLVLFSILMVFDWRLGLASLIPAGLAYFTLVKGYGSAGAGSMMTEYQNHLEDMNNASVEYVRGISVIKAFNQTMFSFRKFHESIAAYTRYCLKYTECFENYMAIFLVLLNAVYLFIMPVAVFMAGWTIIRITPCPCSSTWCSPYLSPRLSPS